MGLFIQSELETASGIKLTNTYLRIRTIDIINNTNSGGVYQIGASYEIYATKDAREQEKEIIKKGNIAIGSESLENIHGQLYTEIKRKFENGKWDIDNTINDTIMTVSDDI